MTELEQIKLSGTGFDSSLPTDKIRKAGKPSQVPINQGDIFQPEKIKVGNMLQDQTVLIPNQTRGGHVQNSIPEVDNPEIS